MCIFFFSHHQWYPATAVCVVVTLTSAALISLNIFMFFQTMFFATTCFKVISIAYLKCFMLNIYININI